MPLVLKPLLREWEEPRGLLQRAAVQRGAASTRAFANRIGFPVGVLPTAEQVGRLEIEFGVPSGSIRERAICAAGHNLATLRGETIPAGPFVRTLRHVCPACLEEDRADDNLEDVADVRPWIRSFWALSPVTCCPLHFERLVSRCACGAVIAGLDGPVDRCAQGHSVKLSSTPVSTKEADAVRYILGRLADTDGPSDGFVLDSMSWPQAARTMMRIGLFKMHGRNPPSLKVRPRPEIVGEAMAVGIDQLKRFPASFEQLLDELSSPDVRKRGGPIGRYGVRFYSYMERAGPGQMDQFRIIFERHAGIDRGNAAASRSQESRQLWAAPLNASEMWRFRRMVPLSIPSGPLTRRAAFDLCRPSGMVVAISTIAAELGIGRDTAMELVERGVLKPAWHNRGLLRNWFYPGDASEFRARMLESARPVDMLPEGALRLADLRSFALKLSAAFEAIMTGLVRPMRVVSVDNLSAMAVGPDALEAIWRLSVGRRLMLVSRLKREARLSDELAIAAASRGLLSFKVVAARQCVGLRQVENFRNRFVSAAALASEFGLQLPALVKHLDANGCVPFVVATVGRLYERSNALPFAEALAGSHSEAAINPDPI